MNKRKDVYWAYMVIQFFKNYFELIVNFKDAYNYETLTTFYSEDVDQCLSKYNYIIGDLSDGQLRLKGFNSDKQNLDKTINKYLTNSCTFECPYYVLHKISSDEYKKRFNENVPVNTGPEINHLTIEKENFDKDSLILERSEDYNPQIVIDINRINSIKIGKLPDDVQLAKVDNEEKTVTTITASEGFVPVKKQRPYNNKSKKNNYHKSK